MWPRIWTLITKKQIQLVVEPGLEMLTDGSWVWPLWQPMPPPLSVMIQNYFYFIPHYCCLKRQDEQWLPPKELYIITRMKPAHVMVCSPVRLVHLCQWVKMLMSLWTDHDTQFINVDQTNIIITTNIFIVLTIRLTHYNILD